MTTPTKGPWKMDSNGIIRAKSRNERQAIGMFQGIASEQVHIDEHYMNCRLIEASPELLEEARISLRNEYNPFEPDNQSERYHRLKALVERLGETAW